LSNQLTGRQTRRAWRCLDKMANNYPVNPMDIGARSRMADENLEASRSLADACDAAIEGWGAEEVNRYLGKAEDTLGLKRV